MRKSYRYRADWGWGAIIAFLVFLALYIIGWFMNIVDLFQMASVMTGEGAVRIAGIFVPFLGPILGWFF